MAAGSPGTFALGPRLTDEGSARIFHHGGANDSYKAYIEGNLDKGDGSVIVTHGASSGALGDEIRNVLSDSLRWPEDWSVETSSVTAAGLLDEFVGGYRQRAGQSSEMLGIRDTGLDFQDLAVPGTPDGLQLQARQRRPIKSVSSDRFVAPDAYIPAGTVQVAFNRGVMHGVRSLVLIAGGAVAIFDKQAA